MHLVLLLWPDDSHYASPTWKIKLLVSADLIDHQCMEEDNDSWSLFYLVLCNQCTSSTNHLYFLPVWLEIHMVMCLVLWTLYRAAPIPASLSLHSLKRITFYTCGCNCCFISWAWTQVLLNSSNILLLEICNRRIEKRHWTSRGSKRKSRCSKR